MVIPVSKLQPTQLLSYSSDGWKGPAGLACVNGRCSRRDDDRRRYTAEILSQYPAPLASINH